MSSTQEKEHSTSRGRELSGLAVVDHITNFLVVHLYRYLYQTPKRINCCYQVGYIGFQARDQSQRPSLEGDWHLLELTPSQQRYSHIWNDDVDGQRTH